MIGDKIRARTQALGADGCTVPRQKAHEFNGFLSAKAALLVGLILN